jgi:hypothetical protein
MQEGIEEYARVVKPTSRAMRNEFLAELQPFLRLGHTQTLGVNRCVSLVAFWRRKRRCAPHARHDWPEMQAAPPCCERPTNFRPRWVYDINPPNGVPSPQSIISAGKVPSQIDANIVPSGGDPAARPLAVGGSWG